MENSGRPLAKFLATVWDDHFILSMETSIPESQVRHIEVCKEKVRNMLVFTSEVAKKVGLIEELYKLGVSYHFESEIEDELKQIWENQDALLASISYFDLYTTALFFRVFRRHGFPLHSDIFDKFKDDCGKLKEELASDVNGVLSLYEATFLSIHGEQFLDEVRRFSISSLKSLMTTEANPHLMQYVLNSLQWPTHTGVNRLKARQYISFYENQENYNEMLLKFAKMDFNVVQSLHRRELCQLLRWWRESNLAKDLSYSRDRIVEAFFLDNGIIL